MRGVACEGLNWASVALACAVVAACSSPGTPEHAAATREAVASAEYSVVASWGSTGTANGQFEAVASISVEPSAVLVGDGSDRIQEFTHGGAFIASWGATGSADGQFENTDGLFATASPDGATVYVADSGALSRVQKFALRTLDQPCPDNTVEIPSTGQRVCLVTKWGQLGSGDGEFIDPNSVAIAGDGEVYVLDQNNNRVEVFRQVPIGASCPIGTTETAAYAAERTCFVRKWGEMGSGDGQLYGPESLALDDAGQRVFVTDTFNNRVEVFRPDGTFLYQWGSAGTGDSEFNLPQGIAVDPARNRAFVADTGNSRIQVFDASGQFITAFGHFGSGPGELSYPSEVDLDAAGRVYVADQANDRIQVFEQNGIAGTAVSVPAGATLALAAGDYSAITLGAGARVTLSGGLYRANTIVLEEKARLEVTAATQLRVFQSVTTGEKVTIGPAPGSHLTANDLRVGILGGDGTLADSTAAAFTLGPKSDATGLFYVPYGTIQIDPNATLRGDACAPGPTFTALGAGPDACGLNIVTRPGGTFAPLPATPITGWLPISSGTCDSQPCTDQAVALGTDLHCNSVKDTCCGLCAGVACATTAALDGSKGVAGNRCDAGYFCESATCTDQRIDMPFLYQPYQTGQSLLPVYEHEDHDPAKPIHTTYMTLGPFGAHAGGNTGHTIGDFKANDVAYFFPDRTGMFNVAALAPSAPPSAHCTYPFSPTNSEVCGVPWQYLVASTPGYHLPDVQGRVYVQKVILQGFPLPTTARPIWFRHAPEWGVELVFQDRKVEIRPGHLARIPADTFLWQMIRDVTAKYDPSGNGVGIDVDVPRNDCDATTGLCSWKAEDFARLRKQMYDYWQKVPPLPANPGDVIDGTTREVHCPPAAPSDPAPAACEVPWFSHGIQQSPHQDQLIEPVFVQNRAYFAEPQVHAVELAGHPGYFAAPFGQEGGPSPVPDADFEFTARAIPPKGDGVADGCVYEFLGGPGVLTQAQAQLLHNADMAAANSASVQSLRYEAGFTPAWQWGAEGPLCPSDAVGPLDDFSALYTHLGGWGEGTFDPNAAPPNAMCSPLGDQDFVFFPAEGDYWTAHQSLWTDSGFNNALARNLVVFINHSAARTWVVNGGGAADYVFPADHDVQIWGDVLVPPVAGESRGSMLVRWRSFDAQERACNTDASPGAAACVYEKLAYTLTRTGPKPGLSLAWGTRFTSANAAANEKLDPPAGGQCDGDTVICYAHCRFP